MTEDIPRDPENAQNQEWGRKYNKDPSPAWGKSLDGTVWIRCKCRVPIPLDPKDHVISDDGTVSPSIWHNDGVCEWHVFGRLLGWESRP